MFWLLVAERWSVFREGRFMGKVLDEWIADSQEFVRKLPHLVAIAVIALILNRLLAMLTHRMVRVAESHAAGPGRLAEVRTLASVIRATGLAVIGVIAGFMIVSAMGLNLAPLLASAGVAGVAIGLAAQTIVKDMFNGILILLEGQFNVGDQVKLAGLSGVVESMTLRKTTVRDSDGTLYVIPNSQITTVANLSVDYSAATVNVSVDFSANPDEVLTLLGQIAMDVRNSEQFRSAFKADPQVLGVDSVKGSQLIFPVVFKTWPQQQYGPIREFQRRVRLALEERHILPGDPNRVYGAAATAAIRQTESARDSHPDPTTLKPQESNPFAAE
ncbi:MAG TPA: mechanosensitive ion channel family protein [Terracidiphilus sp.]|nr:mechanosensitive ion channel family protein [Terracidiphilus sp.]